MNCTENLTSILTPLRFMAVMVLIQLGIPVIIVIHHIRTSKIGFIKGIKNVKIKETQLLNSLKRMSVAGLGEE